MAVPVTPTVPDPQAGPTVVYPRSDVQSDLSKIVVACSNPSQEPQYTIPPDSAGCPVIAAGECMVQRATSECALAGEISLSPGLYPVRASLPR